MSTITDIAAAGDFPVQSAAQKKAPGIKTGGDFEKTRQTVQDFEAFFISQSFEQMYSTVPVNETFGGGNAEKIFRSMMVDEYGKMLAKSGGIGLTDQIMTQLIQQQAVEPAPAGKAE